MYIKIQRENTPFFWLGTALDFLHSFLLEVEKSGRETFMPRLIVTLSKEIDDRLEEIAKQGGISKAEAMTKAFALLSAVKERESEDTLLAIVRENSEKKDSAEIVYQFVGV